MPPFRAGPVTVDRRFNGETLQELRDIGHGHRVTIVDASYDIPRGARIVPFPGSSAEALLGVVRLVPIEGSIELMDRDPELEAADQDEAVSAQAAQAFEEALTQAGVEGIDTELIYRYRNGVRGSDGVGGFYDVANNDPQSLFVRTIDDLPFACASLTVGHSQRTG